MADRADIGKRTIDERVYADPEQPGHRTAPPPSRRPALQLALLALIVIVLLCCGAGIAYFWLNARDVGATDTPSEATASAPAATPSAASTAPTAPVAAAPASTTADAPKITPFQDWVLACPADAPDSQKCTVEQQVRSNDGKALFMVWSFRKDEQGGVHGVWQTPPDAVQAQGIALDVGDGQPKLLKFSACTAKVCTALAAPTADYLQKLETSTALSATFSSSGSPTPVRLGLSSRGLADALSHIPRPE